MFNNDSIDIFLNKYKKIQTEFLVFLEDEENIEENFKKLKLILEDISKDEFS